jgi:hypothetical protein
MDIRLAMPAGMVKMLDRHNGWMHDVYLTPPPAYCAQGFKMNLT